MPVVMTLDPGCASAMLQRMAADSAAGLREPSPGTSRCSALIAILKVPNLCQCYGLSYVCLFEYQMLPDLLYFRGCAWMICDSIGVVKRLGFTHSPLPLPLTLGCKGTPFARGHGQLSSQVARGVEPPRGTRHFKSKILENGGLCLNRCGWLCLYMYI